MLRGRTTQITLAVLALVLAVGVVITYKIVSTPPVENKAEQLLFSKELENAFSDTTGAPVSLGDFEGESLIVTTWASWCPQCTDELVLLNRLMEERDTKITVLALNRSEPLPQIERFKATLPPLPHITFIVDTNDQFFANALGYAMPETLVFDENGGERYRVRGNSDEQSLRTVLETLAAE